MSGPDRTCHDRQVPTIARRLSAVLLAGILLVALAGSASASLVPYSEATLVKAGLDQVRLTNLQRTSHGLVALRIDPGVMAVARDRAKIMAANDDLDHQEPGGGNAFDRLSTAGIAHYAAGEIIAWNTYDSEADSVSAVIKAWMKSPGHHDIMMSTNYNYVGFGAAVAASGKRYYAGVFIKGPDHTGAYVKLGAVTRTIVTASRTRVRLSWTGADTKLQVLTSGLRNYEVQRRYGSGPWVSWGTRTTTHLSVTWARHRTYQIRVRASDKVGNWGSWRTVTIRL